MLHQSVKGGSLFLSGILCTLPAVASPTLKTLATFTGGYGRNPFGNLLADDAGNLYGTTMQGGANNAGTIFELANDANRTLSTLATFNVSNGQYPYGGLVADAAGNLFGTTYYGGTSGYGTVFELAHDPGHTLTTLRSFNFGTDGSFPRGSLILDAAGNLYGTTVAGSLNNAGSVFKVANDANHTLTNLVMFGQTKTADPHAALLVDSAGNLLGTTYGGSTSGNPDYGSGYGTVFSIAPDAGHTLTTLATFVRTNGANPASTLVTDSAGNLYGTTYYGGAVDQNLGWGNGTVFKVANDANHTLTTLVTFNGTNGSEPDAGLIVDAAGNLFGTTSFGGVNHAGTIFRIANDTDHSFTSLVSFDVRTGAVPEGSLIADAAGNLYGTTSAYGTNGNATIFELSGSGFVVPEPASLSFLAFAAVPLMRRRFVKQARR